MELTLREREREKNEGNGKRCQFAVYSARSRTGVRDIHNSDYFVFEIIGGLAETKHSTSLIKITI